MDLLYKYFFISRREASQLHGLRALSHLVSPLGAELTIQNSRIQNSNILDIFRRGFKPRLKLIGGSVAPTPHYV